LIDQRSATASANAMTTGQHFASDNYAGVCPEALAALLAANDGHVRSYGDDQWTLRAADRLREVFATDCDVYFVFNGTAANSLALAALCQSYHSVICHQLAHVETDECGAPEFFSNGAKLLALAGEEGKLTPAAIEGGGDQAHRHPLPEAEGGDADPGQRSRHGLPSRRIARPHCHGP
jgi:threonine aldolase